MEQEHLPTRRLARLKKAVGGFARSISVPAESLSTLLAAIYLTCWTEFEYKWSGRKLFMGHITDGPQGKQCLGSNFLTNALSYG